VKGTKEKISVVFLFVILLGANVANLQLISSVVPKYNWREPPGQVVEKKEFGTDSYGLDYQTLVEVSEFILGSAEQNNYQFDCVVFSAALLFESEDALIIIGHGHFNLEGQYSIGDYSASSIQKLANKKEFVALLACYSATIKLTNKKQLIYQNSIDLITAIEDLSDYFAWIQKNTFTLSQNIQLFDLDSGGGNGLTDAPEFFTSLKYAFSVHPDYGDTYWNLNFESAMRSLSSYMMNYKYRRVEFTFTGTHYVELVPDSGNYVANSHSCTFNAWLSIEGDTQKYVQIRDVLVDGNDQKKDFSMKLEELMLALDEATYRSNVIAALGIFAGTFVAIGASFLAAAISLKLAVGALATSGTMATTAMVSAGWTVASLSGLVTLCTVLGITCIVIAILTAITVVILAATWR